MRLSRTALADEDHRFGALDVSAIGKFADAGGGNVLRLIEVKLFECLHSWKMGLLKSACNSVTSALLHFHCQQNFQVSLVRLLLTDRLFGHRFKMRGNGRGMQRLAILTDSGFF